MWLCVRALHCIPMFVSSSGLSDCDKPELSLLHHPCHCLSAPVTLQPNFFPSCCRETPAGVSCAEGQYYNAYFPGGKIGMPKQLVDGAVDYPDGTPSTESQMAKDVSVFLAWASEPEHDDRKRLGLKWFLAVVAMAALTGYYKRFRYVTHAHAHMLY